MLAQSVVVDFGGSLAWLKQKALAYADLSPEGDSVAAARALFATLRWTEGVEGAGRVLVADIEHSVAKAYGRAGGGPCSGAAQLAAEHTASVADRAFRAASGRILVVDFGGIPPLS